MLLLAECVIYHHLVRMAAPADDPNVTLTIRLIMQGKVREEEHVLKCGFTDRRNNMIESIKEMARGSIVDGRMGFFEDSGAIFTVLYLCLAGNTKWTSFIVLG